MLYNTPDNKEKSFLRKQDHFINLSVNLCRTLLSANNSIYPLPWGFFKDDETKKYFELQHPKLTGGKEANQGVGYLYTSFNKELKD